MNLNMSFSAYISAFTRIIRLGIHFAHGLLLIGYQRLRRGRQWFLSKEGAATIRSWMHQASTILGMEIQITGTSASGAAVLVANHVSWLDIVALSASTSVTFVSKSELQRWPIISTLSKATGTVFIKRGSLQTMQQTLNQLTEVISQDHSTVFFPEGTTTVGVQVKKFHSGLFEVAHRTRCILQPVAISYFRCGEQDLEIAPYVDDDHFIKHLWRLVLNGGTLIQLDFLEEIKTDGKSRQQLAEMTNKRISEMLKTSIMIHQDYPPLLVEVA